MMVADTPKKVYEKLTGMVRVGFYLTPAELKILESAFVEKPKPKAPAKTKAK